MKTISDAEAFLLGARALQSGMRLALGNIVLTAHHNTGIVVGFDGTDTLVMSMGATSPRAPGYVVPDLRDPGTKGHAMSQLRKRIGNPRLIITENHPEHPSTQEQVIAEMFEKFKVTP